MSSPSVALPVAFTASTDPHKLDAAIRDWASRSDLSENQLLAALACLPRWCQTFTDSCSLEQRGEQINWFGYESVIWALGEAFRQVLKRQKRLRGQSTLFEQIEAVCRDARFGKGRESFVMLLEQYGGIATVATLLELLDDSQVSGHAVYSLRLLGACEAADRLRPFLQHNKAWIRQQARKFFAKCEGHA